MSAKVIFLTEGGKNIGFGHITRCISLLQAFEEKGVISEFIVNGDDTVSDFLKEKKQVFDWLKDKQLPKPVKNAAIVIIDSYLADLKIYQRIAKSVKLAMYIDDNRRIDYPAGVVLNGALYAKELGYPERKGAIYLLGNQYTLLRKEFRGMQEKGIKSGIETILITFGGSDFNNMMPKILKLLTDNYPSLYKKAIVGKGCRNIDEIRMLEDKNIEVIYAPKTIEMRDLMQGADIAISAGGQTLSELAAAGVPTIGICVAKNQLNNIRDWEKAGFIEYAGSWEDGDLAKRLKECIENIRDANIRKDRSLKGQRVIDGNGCLRVRDFLLERI